MELVAGIVSGVFLVAGAFFNIAAGIGVLRLPDVFTRLHAAGMKDTMGSGFTLVGLAILGGFSLVTVKLIIVWALLWLTCSVATHSVARAAFLGGTEPILADGGRGPKVAEVREAAAADPDVAAPPVREGP